MLLEKKYNEAFVEFTQAICFIFFLQQFKNEYSYQTSILVK